MLHMYTYHIGIGKTTLANEICVNWAKEEFLHDDYDLIILIQLRDLLVKSLEEIIIDLISKETFEELKHTLGSKCLIILDGLDEVNSEWQKSDETFIQLVRKNILLEEAKILITSRPHACVELYANIKQATRRIEIIGFNKEQIKNYAKCFLDTLDANNFMQQLEKYSHISSLCYIPLSLKMIIDGFRYCQQILPDTLTKLYQAFVFTKIKGHCIRTGNTVASSIGTVDENDKEFVNKLSHLLNDLAEAELEPIFLLSKLAYNSWFDINENATIERPQIIYTSDDLANCNITLNQNSDAYGFLKATHVMLYSDDVTYSFNHLSIQEYFCALYISLLPEVKQLQLIKGHLRQYPHIWPFYAGMTKLKSQKVLEYLCSVISQTYDCWEDCRVQTEQTITILQCIYETQQVDVCKQFQPSVHLLSATLLPYSCASISYFMLAVQATHLNIPHCYIEPKMLTKYEESMKSLKTVHLDGTHLTAVDVQHIIRNIGEHLTHLLISSNRLNDEGIKLLMSSLLSLPHLIELDIMNINMVTNGAISLGKFLQQNTSLQSLNISLNDIGDDGMTAICNGLQLNNNKTKLVQLIAVSCSIQSTVNISKMLEINKTLKRLNISFNQIGDDGFASIVDALSGNTTLTELEAAYHTEMGNSGSTSLLKLINTSKSLKIVTVSNKLRHSVPLQVVLENSTVIYDKYGANTMRIFINQKVSKLVKIIYYIASHIMSLHKYRNMIIQKLKQMKIKV